VRALLSALVLASGLVLGALPVAAASAPAPPPPPGPAPADPPAIDAAVLRTIAIAEDERRLEPELKKLLADPNPVVRVRATLAVGRIQDSTSVPMVLPLLDDANVDVRREAVFALGQIGRKSAREAVEKKLADPDADVSRLAIEALGKLGDKAASAKVAAFLTSADRWRRMEAGVALWRLADSTALTALLAAHNDPDVDVRWRVLYAMEKVVAPERVVLVAASHLDDPEWVARAYAARTLGRQKAPRALSYLFQRLDDDEIPVVVNALRAIQLIADSTSKRSLGEVVPLLGHWHPYVRVTAATLLAERPVWVAADSASRAAAFDSLRVHLKDSDPATRGMCARALLLRLGSEALAAAKPVLEDPDVYARIGALPGLAGLPKADAAAYLMPLLDAQVPLTVRMTAADQLGAIGIKSAIPQLRAGLDDKEPLVVAASAGALETLEDFDSAPALMSAYAKHVGDDPDARIAIRDALRTLAGKAKADSVEKAHPVRTPKVTYTADFGQPSKVRGAVIHTASGDVEIQFYRVEAVQAVKNFVALAQRGYFDGSAFHRVVPNFVIQDGDPTGTGAGGPGYTIRCEYNRIRYEPGMVGMALSGKDTGGSQWFITHSPQPHLNGKYTIFARVVRGQDVVGRIVQGTKITKIELLAGT